MKSALLLCAIGLSSLLPRAHSQAKPIGTVPTADAEVTAPAALQTTGPRATLTGSATVTAKPNRNAAVSLARGGSVLVCQTTAVHISANSDALLLALDRGAMEVHMKASAGDIVMTPDLRFTMAAPGPLDLRMRVTFNGDTCVENRGRKAPQLNISDAFGESAYLLKPGQHVMFEHGSLRAVMDRETTPCGCPPPEPAGVPLAEALLRGGPGTVTPAQAAAAHPFPTAQSDGLATPAPATPETPGERHVQVSGTLRFDPDAPAKAADAQPTAALPPTLSPAPAAVAQSAPQPQPSHNPFVAVGHFFKRLFVR
jgi:hypothetical protein